MLNCCLMGCSTQLLYLQREITLKVDETPEIS